VCFWLVRMVTAGHALAEVLRRSPALVLAASAALGQPAHIEMVSALVAMPGAVGGPLAQPSGPSAEHRFIIDIPLPSVGADDEAEEGAAADDEPSIAVCMGDSHKQWWWGGGPLPPIPPHSTTPPDVADHSDNLRSKQEQQENKKRAAAAAAEPSSRQDAPPLSAERSPDGEAALDEMVCADGAVGQQCRAKVAATGAADGSGVVDEDKPKSKPMKPGLAAALGSAESDGTTTVNSSVHGSGGAAEEPHEAVAERLCGAGAGGVDGKEAHSHRMLALRGLGKHKQPASRPLVWLRDPAQLTRELDYYPGGGGGGGGGGREASVVLRVSLAPEGVVVRSREDPERRLSLVGRAHVRRWRAMELLRLPNHLNAMGAIAQGGEQAQCEWLSDAQQTCARNLI
jgi:hypothetical protein